MKSLRFLGKVVAHPWRSLRAAAGMIGDYVFTHWAIPVARGEIVSKAFLKRWLPAQPVVVDCGACDGADSMELTRILGATVFAFEPLPELYARLATNAAGDPRVRPFNLALGDTDGTAQFHVSGGTSDASSSLLPPKEVSESHPTVTFSKTIEVPILTLETWAREQGVSRIDLLWLDVQGYELRLLEGAGPMLDAVRVIHAEVNLRETYAGAALYSELKTWLEGKGFRVVLELIPEGWVQGNVVFVR